MAFAEFNQTLTGTRRDPDTLVKGRVVTGATSPLSFSGSVQPITGNERQALPEGLRERGRYYLYTDFALRTENQTTKEPADEVDLFGSKYKVVFLEPWQNNILSHYRALVSEAD